MWVGIMFWRSSRPEKEESQVPVGARVPAGPALPCVRRNPAVPGLVAVPNARGGAASLYALSRRSFTGESIGFGANPTFAAIPLALFGIVTARRAGRRGLERFGILLFFLSLPLLSVINGRSVVVTALWAFAMALFIESQRRLRLIATIVAAAAIVAASVVGLA
jgi:hypothetical protein